VVDVEVRLLLPLVLGLGDLVVVCGFTEVGVLMVIEVVM